MREELRGLSSRASLALSAARENGKLADIQVRIRFRSSRPTHSLCSSSDLSSELSEPTS